jgi:hypothetical protein
MLRFSEAISPILRTFGARDVSLLRSLCRFENITASLNHTVSSFGEAKYLF